MSRASAVALSLALVLASAARADEFDTLVNAVNPHNRVELAERMTRWVDAHLTDPRSPRGLVWAAQLELLASHRGDARALYERVLRDYPGTPWALQATKGIADVDLLDHHFERALSGYRALAARPEPFWKFTGRVAAEHARGEAIRFGAMVAIAIGLLLFWGVAFARVGFGQLWPWPQEVLLTLPLLFVLALASAAQPGPERGAVLTVALGGAVLIWINGAWLRARPPRRSRIAWAVFGVAQSAALLFCAFAANGLWDKLMDTVTMGVDR